MDKVVVNGATMIAHVVDQIVRELRVAINANSDHIGAAALDPHSPEGTLMSVDIGVTAVRL
jgi:hypothetical protein